MSMMNRRTFLWRAAVSLPAGAELIRRSGRDGAGVAIVEDGFHLTIGAEDFGPDVASLSLWVDDTRDGDSWVRRRGGLLSWGFDVLLDPAAANRLRRYFHHHHHPVTIGTAAGPVGPTNPRFSGRADLVEFGPVVDDTHVSASFRGRGKLDRGAA